LRDRELKEILKDEKTIEEELRFVKDRATEISKSQPPKAFNWEIEFPEVFFSESGTLKENPGFDCVVGNPPWGRIKQFPEKIEKDCLVATGVKKANLIRLDEFLKGALDDFDVISSFKVKHDNFDALRLRIEGDRVIVE